MLGLPEEAEPGSACTSDRGVVGYGEPRRPSSARKLLSHARILVRRVRVDADRALQSY